MWLKESGTKFNIPKPFEPIIPPPIEVRKGPFVGREKELKIFTNMVNDFLASLSEEDEQQKNKIVLRTLHLKAPPRMGNRTLIKEMASRVNDLGYDVYYVDFRCPPTEVASTKNILSKLEREHPGAKITLRKEGGIDAEYNHNERPYFLFVNQPASDAAKEEIGSTLESHAVKKNVFVTTTYSTKGYPWRAPELRLYARFHEFGPFSQEETAQQMKSLGYEGDPLTIHKITDGHPLANALIASGATPLEAIDTVIRNVIQNSNVGNQYDPELVHELLLILSTPKATSQDGFYQGPAQALILASQPNETLAPIISEIINKEDWLGNHTERKAILPLLSLNLLKMGEGFICFVEPTLRALLQRYLALTDPDLFIKLHLTLKQLYNEFASETKTPGNKEYWLNREKYHQEVIQKFGKSRSVFELDL